MIKYSTQPGQGSNALKNNSPTSPTITTRDVKGLNDSGKPSQDVASALDLDAEDANDN